MSKLKFSIRKKKRTFHFDLLNKYLDEIGIHRTVFSK